MKKLFYICINNNAIIHNLKTKIMETNSKREDIRINEIAKLLKEHYDCISKLDAIKFVRKICPNERLRLINEAYYLAYPSD